MRHSGRREVNPGKGRAGNREETDGTAEGENVVVVVERTMELLAELEIHPQEIRGNCTKSALAVSHSQHDFASVVPSLTSRRLISTLRLFPPDSCGHPDGGGNNLPLGSLRNGQFITV